MSAADVVAVERASGLVAGLTVADLDRVGAFVQTSRARRHVAALHALEVRFKAELPQLPWRKLDVLTLAWAIQTDLNLYHAIENGFPPETTDAPIERLHAIWCWLMLLAEDADQLPLAYASRALAARLVAPGAWREIFRRTKNHAGFDAAVLPLHLYFEDEEAATKTRSELQRRALKRLPRPGKYEREEVDGEIMEGIYRRLRGRHDLVGRVAAALESLPPDPRVSSWDYVSHDAGIAVNRRMAVPRHSGELKDEQADSPERHRAARELLTKLAATPEGRALLDLGFSGDTQATVARRAGKGPRTIRNYLGKLRPPGLR